MSATVCLTANCLTYTGGGHVWVYLNWALGLQALGCRVIWLEQVDEAADFERLCTQVSDLKQRLTPYGLADTLALYTSSGNPLSPEIMSGCLDLEAATEADLLLNLQYGTPSAVVGRFPRSAMLDIDPGLLQTWMSQGLSLPPHHLYFTIGETVGCPGTRVPDVGLEWQYTPPCIVLDYWPEHRADLDAPFTTVSHWYSSEWMNDDGTWYQNDKRSAFLPYLDLPTRTQAPLELALCLAPDESADRQSLQSHGWRVRDSGNVANTPQAYQQYVQGSRGEFSCAKPVYVRLQTAWISDRTLCYLASGKPAIVQHTGPSRFLPDAVGLFRFRDTFEAVQALETVLSDYEFHGREARSLALEYFDARKVSSSVLDRALT